MGSYGFSIFIMSSCVVIMAICLLLLLISLCKPSVATAKLLPIQKYGAILCILLSILCSILDIVHTSTSMPHTTHIDDSKFATITTLADICYFSSSILLYIIFFHRIYKSFHNTMYEVSKQYVVFLSIMISIYGIFILIYVLLVATNQPAGIIYYAIFMIIELIVSFALLFEFIFKLRQVIFSQIDADLYQYVIQPAQNNVDHDAIELGSSYSDNFSDVNSDIELDMQQIAMITLITKICILSIVAIIGVQIFWISVLIATGSCKNELSQTGCNIDVVEPILYGIRGVMLTINVIVLHLNFDFNATIYTKICKHIHMKCYTFCARRIKTEISQNINDQTAAHYQKL
eukprot:273885_1